MTAVDAIAVIGLVLLLIGVATLASVPAALVVAGVALLVYAVAVSLGEPAGSVEQDVPEGRR